MVGIRFTADGLDVVELRLDRFRQNMTGAEPVMWDLAEHVRTTVFRRTFDQQGLDGARWASLSPRYAAHKARVRPGRPILQFDGDLVESMTTPRGGIAEAWDTGFTVGTDVPYARFHQDGTPTMPARPMVGPLQQRDKRQLVKIIQRHIIEGTGA